MGFIAIYITNGSKEKAHAIAAHLLNQKLVACANIFSVNSAYWWQGKITNDDEWVAMVKTRKANWEKVKQEVTRVHEYDVPCIMKFEVEANESYEQWILKETR